jgi:hypothetical protein
MRKESNKISLKAKKQTGKQRTLKDSFEIQ